MSSSQQRIRLLVDVFATKNQKADALPSLVPAELVEAILQEFQGEKDLEYLSNTPELYYLLRASDRSPLDENTPLGQQVSDQEQLVLAEQEMPLPNGTQRPTQPIYMREQTAEQATSQVYKLHWLPAIIGRRDKKHAQNEFVVVDLASHAAGLRVSRRHAQITEEKGKFYVEGLSQNPTIIEDTDGNQTPLNSTRHLLHHKDLIHLERSQITLQFLVRDAT